MLSIESKEKTLLILKLTFHSLLSSLNFMYHHLFIEENLFPSNVLSFHHELYDKIQY
jgi:hypothetical protein